MCRDCLGKVHQHEIIVLAGRLPFRMLFKTDDNEVTAAGTGAIADETSGVPAGIVGFSLDFWMVPCAGGTIG